MSKDNFPGIFDSVNFYDSFISFTEPLIENEHFKRFVLVGLPTLVLVSLTTVFANICYANIYRRASENFNRRFTAGFKKNFINSFVTKKDLDSYCYKLDTTNHVTSDVIDELASIRNDINEKVDRFTFTKCLNKIGEDIDNVYEELYKITGKIEEVIDNKFKQADDRFDVTNRNYDVTNRNYDVTNRNYDVRPGSEIRNRSRSLEEYEPEYDLTEHNRYHIQFFWQFLISRWPEEDHDELWDFSAWVVENYSSLIDFEDVENIDIDFYWDVWRQPVNEK